MTPMPESTHEALLTQRVRRAGGMSVKLAPTHAGLPDRMIIMPPGRIYLVELKTTTGRLRPAQRAWIARAERIGVHVDVLYGRDDVLAWVDWAARPEGTPR